MADLEHNYKHIAVIREPDREPERRKRPAIGLPKPPVPEDRRQHGIGLERNTIDSIEQVSKIRKEQGIDPSKFLVLEFDSINFDLHKVFEERFQAWIVDERRTKASGQDSYRFLVQFSDEAALHNFQEEVRLYEAESLEQSILPPVLRRDFFDGLQKVGFPAREDRVGNRLQREGFPTENTFYFDIDLWRPQDEDSARAVLEGIRTVCQKHDGQLIESIRTSSLLLAKILGSQHLAEALLNLDLVARLDLPPLIAQVYSDIFRPLDFSVPPEMPTGREPLVCVVDSGVVAGHPLLVNWVVDEYEFDTEENTPVDLNGHGTAVAGLVLYGDVAQCIESGSWRPKVRICSAKVLQHDKVWNRAVIPDKERIEGTTEKAIRYFFKNHRCKIFNLSLEIQEDIYKDGRQFPWAEKLDELARELDIVIVISTGNRTDPPIPENVNMREQFQKAILGQLLTDKEQRISNPATAALALTVGAVSRSGAVANPQGGGLSIQDAFAASPAGGPAPFTRTGPGHTSDQTKAMIKPDLVHYGGNYALTDAGGNPRWVRQHLLLGEPTIRKEQDGRFVSTQVGTSFACPHVSHAAALASVSLEEVLGLPPSANLIRALVGSATVTPACPPDFLGEEEDVLRLVGYGMCQEEGLISSGINNVRIVAEDGVEEDKLHFYRVVIPKTFLESKGKRGITVALAYDPPVRASRKEYLARSMTVEVLHGLTSEEIEILRGRFIGKNPPKIKSLNILDLSPSKTKVQWSTLQVRRNAWGRRNSPALRIVEGDTEPAIHIIVGCQRRFPTGEDPVQKYGLVVHFWHEGESVELYQALQNRVRLPAARIRVQP
jgi:Subtilase family